MRGTMNLTSILADRAGWSAGLEKLDEDLEKDLLLLIVDRWPDLEESAFAIVKEGKIVLWFYFLKNEEYGDQIELNCSPESDPILIFI